MSISLRERRSDRRYNIDESDIMSEDMEHEEERVIKKARKDKSSGPMDKWVEPTVASKASFEETNGQPYGVLENMQPLGEVPTAKMKAKARKSAGRSVGLSNGATPEGTPQPQIKNFAVDVAEQKKAPPSSPSPSYQAAEEIESSEVPMRQADDSEDEDYAPQVGKKRVRPSRSRAQGSRTSSTPAPSTNGVSRRDRAATSGASRDPIAPEMQEANRKYPDYTASKIKEVVEEAKVKARANGNPDLANAVNETYEESLRNPKVHLLLLKVLTKDATDDELDAFQGHVKLAKRRLARRMKTSIARANAAAARLASNTPSARTQSPEKNSLADKVKKSQPIKSEEQDAPKITLQRTNSHDQSQKQHTQNERSKSSSKRVSTNGSGAAESQKSTETHSLREPQKVLEKAKPVQRSEDVSTNSAKPAEPQSRSTRVKQEQSTVRQRVQSHSPSPASVSQIRLTTRSRASPTPVPKTKQTESIKVVAPTSQPSRTQQPETNTPRRHRTKMNSDSDSSELTDFEDDDGKADSDSSKSLPAEEDSLAPPVTNNKRSAAQADLDQEREVHQAAIQAKKQKMLREVRREYEYEDSYERTKLSSPAKATRGALEKLNAANGIDTTMTNGNGGHDSDSPLSSPTMTERSSPPPFVAAKLNGQRAKTKQSPSKRPNQNAVARPGLGGVGQKDNAAMDIGDSDADASENSDYCSACHASGFLVCCDGCERAFHFTCLDPPLSAESEELNEPWFCYICVAKRQMTEGQAGKPASSIRLFAPLFNSLSKQNPTIFSLPQELQDHFEGAGANSSGDYIERLADGKLSRRRTANNDGVDAFRLVDKKNNYVFCYYCKESSHGTRAIVSCDYCNESWHLDCLDPPLAIHPTADIDGKKRRDWMCPLHIDHEMRHLSAKALYDQQQTRHIRVRRPKKAKVVETSLSRGHRNNGIIEVANEDDDKSDGEFYTENMANEAVVKLPDTGIKLDFIQRIKQHRIQSYHDAQLFHTVHGEYRVASANGRVSTLSDSAATQANLARHSLQDQRTAFNLAQFAQADSNADLALGNGVDTLVAGLVAEAPDKVVAASEGEERNKLLQLQELINRRLSTMSEA